MNEYKLKLCPHCEKLFERVFTPILEDIFK